MPAKPSAIIAQVDVSGTPPVAWKLAKLAEFELQAPNARLKDLRYEFGGAVREREGRLEVIRCE